jgi:hypothetical protein
MSDQIRVSNKSTILRLSSEPYVIYTKHGFVPVIDVLDVESGKSGYLIISAMSLGAALEEIRCGNEMCLAGVTISICKESSARLSPYVVNRID